jgi:predicted transcriptional regulator
VLPVSFKVIVFDHSLLVKKAFAALLQHGVQSAVVFNSTDQSFLGMLTVTDFIQLIVYYYTQHVALEQALEELESLTISGLRDLLMSMGKLQPSVIFCSPDSTLYEASTLLISNNLHRLALLEQSTDNDIVVSVLTHYKILRFIACNVYFITRIFKLNAIREACAS